MISRKLKILFLFILTATLLFGKNYNKILLKALKNEDIVKITKCLENGANVNIKNNYGMPAIVVASAFKNYDLVKLFIEYEADLNMTNKDGGTALHYASGLNQYDIAKLLIEHGANINIKDTNKQTPLFLAVLKGSHAILKLLIENKAKINDRNIKDFTPLMLASQQGEVEIVKTLIENGANVNDTRPMGGEALGFAADRGHVAVVRILLKHGAKINNRDEYGGITALMSAAYMEQIDMVKFLVESGADIHIKDTNGNTALDYAEKKGNKEIITILKNNDTKNDITNNTTDSKDRKEYEPEILEATIDAGVLLYLPGIDVGVTSVKVNNIPQITVKSKNNEKFIIVSLDSINLIEALDSHNEVLTYNLGEYKLQEKGIEKINEIIKNGKIEFEDLLDNIDHTYLTKKQSGSQKAPDPKAFAKLRRVNVYNLLVEDSDNNQNKLQLFIESFTDASELY